MPRTAVNLKTITMDRGRNNRELLTIDRARKRLVCPNSYLRRKQDTNFIKRTIHIVRFNFFSTRNIANINDKLSREIARRRKVCHFVVATMLGNPMHSYVIIHVARMALGSKPHRTQRHTNIVINKKVARIFRN